MRSIYKMPSDDNVIRNLPAKRIPPCDNCRRTEVRGRYIKLGGHPHDFF